jgi:DNA-binding SARP family transcriptional activator
MHLPSAAPDRAGALVRLLGAPSVALDGRAYEIPNGSKKLLAFVALADGAVDRGCVAGALWPAVPDERAAGNLRSALWRLKASGIDVIAGHPGTLALQESTVVDVARLRRWAADVIDDATPTEQLSTNEWRVDALTLLPGWYDDWVIFERERLRQRMLHALEALAVRLTRLRRYAEAVEAALVAVAAEPLRESAQRVLLQVYRAEGNLCEAQRAYRQYADLLRRELGVRPGPDLVRLAQGDSALTQPA